MRLRSGGRLRWPPLRRGCLRRDNSCAGVWLALRPVLMLVITMHLVWATPVAAQTIPSTISPLELQPDHNQVNMVDGQIRVALPGLGIPAAPRLGIVQLQDAMPYLIANVSTGFSAVESSVSIHYGQGPSDTFLCREDDVCSNRKANGSILDGAIAMGGPYVVVRSPEGATYSFDQLSYDSGLQSASRKLIYYVSSIVYPDGETISYTYETAHYPSGLGKTLFRVTRISSSLGYFVSLSYQGNDVNANSWSAVAQATVYQNGNVTPLAQLTFSGTGSITDLAGRTYACTGCDFRVGGQTEYASIALTLPGETAPAIAATPGYFSYFGLVTDVNRDGVNWTYSYNNFRQNPSSVGYAYDSAVVTGPGGYKTTYTMRVGTGWLPNVVASVTDALGRSTSYLYDGSNRIISVTMPEGNSVAVTYDKWGNILRRTLSPKPGSGLSPLTQRAAIDATACAANQVLCYRITRSTDARNAVTTYAYDDAGRLVQQTDPADSQGRVRIRYLTYGASYTAPIEVRTCFQGLTCGTTSEIKTQYTYLGQTALPQTETRVDGVNGVSLVTTFTYDAAGHLLSRDGPLSGTSDASYFRYDAVGRKTWEIDPARPDGTRLARRYTYRASDDKVTSVEVGTIPHPTSTTLTVISRVDTTFDGRRNPVRVAQSAGGTVQSVTAASFDDRGQLICAAVRMNPAAFATAPADACAAGPAGTQGPDRITRQLYDAAGQLIQVRKAVGTADGNADATYSYTGNGKRQFLIDANGNRAQFVYDGFDRLAMWIFPSKTRAAGWNPGLGSTDAATVAATAFGSAGAVNAADYEQYGYDANGNRTSLRKRDGSLLTYSYDALNRMITKRVPERAGLDATHTRDVYYGYDVQDRPAFARFDSPAGQGVTNTFDAFGRLTGTTLTMDGTWTIGHSYDAHGNVASTTYPDGQTVTYSYDALDRPTLIQRGGTASVARCSYDPSGRRSGFDGGVNTRYGYDSIGRLTSLTNNPAANAALTNTWTFAYNPASQITRLTRSNDAFAFAGVYNVSRPYSANGLNQYTAAGAASFGYDANGNLTSDGSTRLSYDIENRLVAASGGKSAALRYDPLGRLYEVTGASGTTRFVWDGDALLAEYDAGGSLLRRYIHGADGKADDPIAWYEGSAFTAANERILRPDWQGSIALVTDSTGTSLIAINTYDEWGIPGPGH